MSDETMKLEVTRLSMDWDAGDLVPKMEGAYCYYDEVAQKLRQAARDAAEVERLQEMVNHMGRLAYDRVSADLAQSVLVRSKMLGIESVSTREIAELLQAIGTLSPLEDDRDAHIARLEMQISKLEAPDAE